MSPVTPMTEDQLALMSHHTERAVTRALHRWRIGATTGFLILLIGVAGAFAVNNRDQRIARDAIIKSGSVVAVDGCNARYHDRAALRAIFIRLQTAVLQQAQNENIPVSSRRVQFALEFYRDQLQRLPLPDCRPTAHILTDQPYPPVRVPTPKHP